MTKTAAEVTSLALEMIGVKPVGEGAAAEDQERARTFYTAVLAELSEREGMAFEWTEDETPDWAFMPLAGIVGARLAPLYQVQAQEFPYLRSLRALVFQDDRIAGQSVGAEFF